MTTVHIDADRIVDWASFHSVFAEALGFFSGYGRNMDAWIDCLTYADDAPAEMMAVTVPAGAVLTLHLDNVTSFATRCPEQYAALVECAAFVNWRRIEDGHAAVLALSFHKR